MASSNKKSAALLLRAILALGRRVRAERPAGSLSLSGLGILGTLNRLGPLVATELAAEERLQPQSLTRLLADLEGSQLIARKRSETDRRAITITITAKGCSTLLADMASRRAWLEMSMKRLLSKREREALMEASETMLRLAVYAGQ